jgi:hypothetical protein
LTEARLSDDVIKAITDVMKLTKEEREQYFKDAKKEKPKITKE